MQDLRLPRKEPCVEALARLGTESSGSQRRRSREWIASFLGKEVAAKQTEVS